MRAFNVYKDEAIFPKVYSEKAFQMITNEIFSKDKECDYDTDKDCVKSVRAFLLRDLSEALDFYVKDDPLMLIDNI